MSSGWAGARLKRREMKVPFCAGWGRGGRLSGKGEVGEVGEVGSGTGWMTMRGGEVGGEGGVDGP